MEEKENKTWSDIELRQLAQTIAGKNSVRLPDDLNKLSLSDVVHVLNELHIHKIEVEMQNEQLRKSQLKLEESRARYYNLFNRAPAGYLTVDGNGVIREANIRFSNMTGIGKKELDGRQTSDFIPEQDQDTWYRFRRKLFGETGRGDCEIRMKKKDGTFFWALLEGRKMCHGEDNSFYQIVVVDISDRKKSEEREQLIRELTQSISDLRQFSYITSHNLRGPLSNIQGLVYLLDELEVPDKEFREIVDDLKISTNVLNETIEDLKRILMIKNNPRVALEPVRFGQVFEQVLRDHRHLIEQQNPRICYDFDEAPSVIFKKIYLESIFQNLLTNSLKYRSPRRKPEIDVRTKDAGDFVILTFADNGIGLDVKKYRDKLFGLYQRFHTHTDSKGMGLYLVRTQIEVCGGSIRAEGAVDKGLEFVIHLQKNPEYPEL